VDGDYRSGDDVVIEFAEHRYRFAAEDFRERVRAAAIRLGLVDEAAVDEAAAHDLAELAATGVLAAPRSALGRYLLEAWPELERHEGQSLLYWLRKLVFRGAWLDQRVKSGLIEVAERSGDFRYLLPGNDARPLVELAQHPSWHGVRYPG
jgi:hypothetical protein